MSSTAARLLCVVAGIFLVGTAAWAYGVQPSASSPSVTLAVDTFTDLDTVISVSTTPTLVATTNSARHAISLQNLSTAVVFCGKAATITSAPANLTAALKAGTAANDGTGGTLGLTNYGGAIYCIVAAGTANVAVGSY